MNSVYLTAVVRAARLVLNAPVELFRTMLFNLTSPYHRLLLVLLVLGGALLLVADTVKRVFSSERQKKNLLADLLMIVLTLFVYYTLVALGIFLVVELFVPIFHIL